MFSRTAPPPSRRYVPRPGQRPLHTRWGAWLRRNRRLVIALLLCLACGIAVHQLTPAAERRVGVASAARDLPAGATLAAADLAILDVPPDILPAGAFSDVSELLGKQLASPLRRGQVPTTAQLLGPGLLSGSPPDSAAVPLRMADPSSIQLVSPGQLINVVLTVPDGPDGGRGAEVLAASVPVLWTSAHGGKAGQWLGTEDSDGLLVVAANPQQAQRLAGSSTQGKLFFVLVNG